jgi:Zn-dependent M28 family amino/carboxypeptidase
VADAELLDHMAARGQPIRVRLALDSHTVPDAPAWNIVGEAVGREKPDEAVVIGGHLDSWDPGTGAIDDGAGVSITVGAAKLINDLPRHPRRTVRVVMFGSEEMGGAGEAYAARHKGEVAKIVLAGESDEGPGPVWSVQLPKGALGDPAMRAMSGVLAPVKAYVGITPAANSGADVEGLELLGVPVISLHPDATGYFDIHHSADDTLDKIDPKALDQSVAAWAALVYAAAESDVDFRAAAK